VLSREKISTTDLPNVVFFASFSGKPSTVPIDFPDPHDLLQEQIKDPLYFRLIEELKGTRRAGESDILRLMNNNKGTYSLDNYTGILLFARINKMPTYVLPPKLRPKVLFLYHDSSWAAHQGWQRVYDKLIQKFYWYGMQTDVKQYVQSCLPCALNKGTRKLKVGFLQLYKPTVRIFQRAHMDIYGPLIRSAEGYMYIVAVICRLSRYIELICCVTMEAEEVAKRIFDQVLCRHGMIEELICDRGSQWRGVVVQTMCSLTNTRVSMTAPYNPRCNSRIERPFRVVGSFLKTIANSDGSNWSDYVMPLQFAMNTSFNSATRKSPYFFVHLRNPRYPPDKILPYPVPRDDSERFSHDLVRRLQQTIKFARENEKRSERDMKVRYDKGRKDVTYGPGELVILDTNTYKGTP